MHWSLWNLLIKECKTIEAGDDCTASVTTNSSSLFNKNVVEIIIKGCTHLVNLNLIFQWNMDFLSSAIDSENVINCPTYLNIFKDPGCLPCNHHFCVECLELFINVKGRIQGQICKSLHKVPDEGIGRFAQGYSMEPSNLKSSQVRFCSSTV